MTPTPEPVTEDGLSERALKGIEARVDYAIGMYHDATRWSSEHDADGEGTIRDYVFAEVRAAIAALNTEPARSGELREALNLARNRLRMAAINEAPKGSKEYYDYSQWADEADAALSKTNNGEKG